MDPLFTDSIDKLFSTLASYKALQEIELNANSTDLWATLEESGFADILVNEEFGGAQLPWADAYSMFELCGQYALPVPLGMTASARWLMSQNGIDPKIVSGSITISTQSETYTDIKDLKSPFTPFGRVANWVLMNHGDSCYLLPTESANVEPTGVYASQQAHLSWQQLPSEAVKIGPTQDLRALASTVTTAMMAGAMSKVLQLVLTHANDRVQFGKPISKFQAVQQQISVLAEAVQAAAITAQMVFAQGPTKDNLLMIAAAKARISELVPSVNATAHAVHGAMGVTEEFHLHYFTRRLNEWRLDYGSEGYWQNKLGKAYLESDSNNALEFLINRVDPKERNLNG